MLLQVLAEWLTLVDRSGRITPELFMRAAREKPLLIEVLERLVPTVADTIFSAAVRATIAPPVAVPSRAVPLFQPSWFERSFSWELFFSIWQFSQAMAPPPPPSKQERSSVAEGEGANRARVGAEEGMRLDKPDFRRLVLLFFGWDDGDMLDSVFFLNSKTRARKGAAVAGSGAKEVGERRWIDLDGLLGAITMIAKGSVKERIRVLCKGHDKDGVVHVKNLIAIAKVRYSTDVEADRRLCRLISLRFETALEGSGRIQLSELLLACKRSPQLLWLFLARAECAIFGIPPLPSSLDSAEEKKFPTRSNRRGSAIVGGGMQASRRCSVFGAIAIPGFS